MKTWNTVSLSITSSFVHCLHCLLTPNNNNCVRRVRHRNSNLFHLWMLNQEEWKDFTQTSPRQINMSPNPTSASVSRCVFKRFLIGVAKPVDGKLTVRFTAGYRRRFYTDNDVEYNAHHLFAFFFVHQLFYLRTMDARRAQYLMEMFLLVCAGRYGFNFDSI